MSRRAAPEQPMTAQVRARTWRSWGGNLTAEPAAVVRPADSDQVLRVLEEAAGAGLTVRPAGSGRSCAPLVPTEDVLLDTSALSGLVSVDEERQRVTVFGGTTLQELNLVLEERGLALANLPDSSSMTVAGAIATGTHGTGLGQPSLGAQVVGVSIATPSGELASCSETHRPDLLEAARVHLGVLGVLVSVTLQCVSAFRLHCAEFREPVAGLVDTLQERMAGADHVEFSWMPGSPAAHTRVLSRLHRLPEAYTRPASPVSRALRRADDAVLRTSLTAGLGRAGSLVPRAVSGLNRIGSLAVSSRRYTDVSYQVFTVARPVRYVATEYALPLENTGAAFQELRTLVETHGYDLSFPVTLRCSPPDRGLLSPAAGRYTGWIALRQYGKRHGPSFLTEAERILVDHGGRPHWAMLHTRTAQDLAPQYPRWDEFLAARAELDPQGLLLNEHTRTLLGV
ncbi:D-arabinono-1,4-lactone oxidase [Kocuria sp.]|uniref:D-arabinono-1,4-lactone oxidase n=1 Tax=Kocuria sp. TaxID=1871328 RepID=UPI0026DD0479|nr:D-arabinono-1,4-lactone oxidase [Kocuria sp.]MDO4918028.1 D-arabinono-1,4-lactone oxidase [Kocuria sp.]